MASLSKTAFDDSTLAALGPAEAVLSMSAPEADTSYLSPPQRSHQNGLRRAFLQRPTLLLAKIAAKDAKTLLAVCKALANKQPCKIAHSAARASLFTLQDGD